MQLAWAIRRAGELGVNIEASQDDLQTMQSQRQHIFKSIRLDDAISGMEMKRPGFTSLQIDAKNDTSISHVFVQKRDRLGRPEEPMELALLEKSICRSGIEYDPKFVFEQEHHG
jgi:predicted site-specific integrase-resolvase